MYVLSNLMPASFSCPLEHLLISHGKLNLNISVPELLPWVRQSLYLYHEDSDNNEIAFLLIKIYLRC